MSVESSRGGILRCRAVLFAVLAALLYAVSTPVSKLLLERISPTMLAGFLYLGAGVGLLLLRAAISGKDGEGAALSLVVLGEPPTPFFWIALAIMAVGTIVVTQDSLKAR